MAATGRTVNGRAATAEQIACAFFRCTSCAEGGRTGSGAEARTSADEACNLDVPQWAWMGVLVMMVGSSFDGARGPFQNFTHAFDWPRARPYECAITRLKPIAPPPPSARSDHRQHGRQGTSVGPSGLEKRPIRAQGWRLYGGGISRVKRLTLGSLLLSGRRHWQRDAGHSVASIAA